MTHVVQKYGGTSVASPARIRAVAERVQRSRSRGEGVVVVVSAMGKTTDQLVALAHELNEEPPSREMDQLLATGETVTAPLLAMTLIGMGVDAISLTGPQAGIRLSAAHRKARIVDIVPERIVDELGRGRVVVVAGFQGVNEALDIATLGRGGSDTTAVALAAALRADHCEIYTDVRGVYTADPRLVPEARPIPEISYEEMLEFAAVGAKVMHPRAVEIGEAYDTPIWVRSSFDESPGTVICRHPRLEDRQKVRGIAHETDVAKVTLLRVPDRPGVAAAIFGPLADSTSASTSSSRTSATTAPPTSPSPSPSPSCARRCRWSRHRGRGRRRRLRHRRRRRQGLDRRHRDAQLPWHRRHDVPHPRRRGHQHPPDQHQRDPDHLPRRPRQVGDAVRALHRAYQLDEL